MHEHFILAGTNACWAAVQPRSSFRRSLPALEIARRFRAFPPAAIASRHRYEVARFPSSAARHSPGQPPMRIILTQEPGQVATGRAVGENRPSARQVIDRFRREDRQKLLRCEVWVGKAVRQEQTWPRPTGLVFHRATSHRKCHPVSTIRVPEIPWDPARYRSTQQRLYSRLWLPQIALRRRGTTHSRCQRTPDAGANPRAAAR